MMIRVAILASLLAACSTSADRMQAFVGRPIQDVLVYRGPPTNAFDMPDGRRAFQWVDVNTYHTSTNVTNAGTAQAIGDTVFWTDNARISGGRPITAKCVYTLFGVWSDVTHAWMVSSFDQPRFGC